MPARRLVVVAILSLAAACADGGEGSSSAATLEVVDSAGVRIVRSAPELWPLPEILRVAAEPILQIGELEGAEEYNLDGVQGVLRSPAGGVVVLEFMSRLRWYDVEGRHTRTLDFFGEGPAEMQGATGLFHYPGDSLLVRGGWSGSGRTLPGAEPYPGRTLPGRTNFAQFMVLDSAGNFGRRGVVWAEGLDGRGDETRAVFANSEAAIAVLGDGSFVSRGNPFVQLEGRLGERVDALHAVTRSTPLGAQFPDTLTLERYSTFDVPRGGAETSTGSRIPYDFVMLDAEAVAPAVSRNRLFLADGETGVISVYEASPEGTPLIGSWRPGFPTVPVDDALVDVYLDAHNAVYADDPDDAADTRSRFRQRGWADSLPRFETLATDRSGRLWVAEGRPWSPFVETIRSRGKASVVESGPTRWTVLSPEGHILGRVDTPLGFQVEEIGDDWILGLVWDELQVARIRMYALEPVAN